MLNKNDLFILEPKATNRSFRGVIFKMVGLQDNLLYTEAVGRIKGCSSVVFVGDSLTVNLNIFRPVKANRDTLEDAGLVPKEQEQATFDKTAICQLSLTAFEKQKDRVYWEFIDSYIQLLKRSAVTNKKSFNILAACLEAEAKQDGSTFSDDPAVKSATEFLNILESIEVIKKFAADKS